MTLMDVRFVAHCGLKSDIVGGPETFTKAGIDNVTAMKSTTR